MFHGHGENLITFTMSVQVTVTDCANDFVPRRALAWSPDARKFAVGKENVNVGSVFVAKRKRSDTLVDFAKNVP